MSGSNVSPATGWKGWGNGWAYRHLVVGGRDGRGVRGCSAFGIRTLIEKKEEWATGGSGAMLRQCGRVKAMKDANDGKAWTETEVRQLMACLKWGDTIEDIAKHLSRSGTINDVRRKAEQLGLKYISRGS